MACTIYKAPREKHDNESFRTKKCRIDR